jgi:hypothetical protein
VHCPTALHLLIGAATPDRPTLLTRSFTSCMSKALPCAATPV